MIKTYRAARRLRIAGEYRQPGQLVPEAVTWTRVESQLHAGHLVEADVEPEELTAAIEQFCPDLADRILERAGANPDVALRGPRRTPRRVAPPAKAPTKKKAPKKAAPRLVPLEPPAPAPEPPAPVA